MSINQENLDRIQAIEEAVAIWRSALCAAWANDHRAVMTVLLEIGPAMPKYPVSVFEEGE